jgi:uncharacterized protein (TIGR02246 family)
VKRLPRRAERGPARPAARLGALLVVCCACASPARADSDRPLLVTVDDLPLASRSLHASADERRTITRDLLAALERHGIHAVGLVTWGNVQDETDRASLEAWLDAGHELGNHSTRHLSYTATEPAAFIADVDSCRARLAEILAPRGRTVRFFRFPFLREGNTTEKVDAMRAYLGTSGQRNLPVTLDNQDWSHERPWVDARRAGRDRDLARIACDYQAALRAEIRDQERRGDDLAGRPLPQILLLHANEVGAAQWHALFAWLAETGHRFAAADEVLGDSIFARIPSVAAPYGFGAWDRIAMARRDEEARAEVAALLAEQSAAWTRGDLEAFCSAYAEDALFVSPSGLTRGRQAVLDRYRAKYPDRAAMGALTLEIVEVRAASGTEVSLLGDARPSRVHGVSVVARWRLEYSDREAKSGLTLLALVRSAGGWRIAQDASM